MKRWQSLPLHSWFEIDQEVAAANQIQPRKRRIADEIVPRECDPIAQRLDYPVAASLLDEEAAQPLG